MEMPSILNGKLSILNGRPRAPDVAHIWPREHTRFKPCNLCVRGELRPSGRDVWFISPDLGTASKSPVVQLFIKGKVRATPHLINDFKRVVGDHVQQSLEDERRVLRISDEIACRLDAIENGGEAAVVTWVLAEADHGAIPEEEDGQLFHVDLVESKQTIQ